MFIHHGSFRRFWAFHHGGDELFPAALGLPAVTPKMRRSSATICPGDFGDPTMPSVLMGLGESQVLFWRLVRYCFLDFR